MEERTEIWKDIKGYEGKYQVSNLGRVKSLNYHQTSKEKIMKPKKDKYGYCRVNLYKYRKSKTIQIHRLVAEAFIPNPENKPCIDHKNTIPSDNRIENLRWCTQKENLNNELTKENFKESWTEERKKEQSEWCRKKYSKKVFQYTKDGELVVEYFSVIEASRQLGINCSHISDCCRGERKTAYGYIWKYA